MDFFYFFRPVDTDRKESARMYQKIMSDSEQEKRKLSHLDKRLKPVQTVEDTQNPFTVTFKGTPSRTESINSSNSEEPFGSKELAYHTTL